MSSFVRRIALLCAVLATVLSVVASLDLPTHDDLIQEDRADESIKRLLKGIPIDNDEKGTALETVSRTAKVQDCEETPPPRAKLHFKAYPSAKTTIDPLEGLVGSPEASYVPIVDPLYTPEASDYPCDDPLYSAEPSHEFIFPSSFGTPEPSIIPVIGPDVTPIVDPTSTPEPTKDRNPGSTSTPSVEPTSVIVTIAPSEDPFPLLPSEEPAFSMPPMFSPEASEQPLIIDPIPSDDVIPTPVHTPIPGGEGSASVECWIQSVDVSRRTAERCCVQRVNCDSGNCSGERKRKCRKVHMHFSHEKNPDCESTLF